jgi:AraC-like DNA-binding protein/mannose-6-phosphate isomerase-like protein (cupin superfamily)
MSTSAGEEYDLRRRLDRIEQAQGDVIASASDYPDGYLVASHRHSRAQLLHAMAGVVMISTGEGRWMVPPDHAMWIPAGVEHSVEMMGEVRMRSAYIVPEAVPHLPRRLRVLAMSGLMRSLIVEAVEEGTGEDREQRAEAIMRLILLELPRLSERPFALPLPVNPRIASLCRGFLAEPSPHVTIDGWAAAAGMSRRSFTRAFHRETGVSLSIWRRQATLFAALPRLTAGASVTTVALDLGYDSAPAFTTMFRQMLGVSPRAYLRGKQAEGKDLPA